MLKALEIFKGVYKIGNKIFTKNMTPGKNTYGEELIKIDGVEYREWNPYRSKLAAAIINNLNFFPFDKNSKVLYLGSAEGTTISHISDIVEEGAIFGIDISAKAMQKFVYLCEQRKNVVPILADAEKPQSYSDYIKNFSIDILYQDISQKDQVSIFLKNSRMYLKPDGCGILVLKIRSISLDEKTEVVLKRETAKLNKEFEIIQEINLEPYDKDHYFIICKRR
ncbi:MAG: fibrillarin-like rRNA/tRNA 2'-O-methyltransferase [Candidatus Diapherotrites archaeon]|nr:fibrillarin-like rRNA/tRNA 2'-O-methyltransferase [Candidatus Diapherotrites archaeon]